MGRQMLGVDVFNMAVNRMVELYEAGHRVVVSFSAGKDSGICLEVCLIAARMTNRLPVEVVMRDEEIMYPGTFEYAERVAARPEVKFHWLVARQPVINVFNRKAPYFWTFDPQLPKESWVREPPAIAEDMGSMNIDSMTTPARFPPAPGKRLFAVIGLRVQESTRRRYAIHSAKGYLTKPNKHGVSNCRPIYDWTDGDVWKAIADNKWDYNKAYDVMHRLGVSKNSLRIAPPTMSVASAPVLQVACRAWPRWWDKVCERLPGVRSVALFGKRACAPNRRLGETWEQCFHRECVDEAKKIGADWIAERAIYVKTHYLKLHSVHSTTPFPETEGCIHCPGGAGIASWRLLTNTMYNGDPFSLKTDATGLPYVEPEFFRAGAGTWGGKPTF